MTRRRSIIAPALIALLILVGAAGVYPMQYTSVPRSGPSTPDILTPGRCYRFVFGTQPFPNYKVLELVDAGWIKAEVDAGPATARREPLWINTRQILAIREARCSA
jgi:hypothetical protein